MINNKINITKQKWPRCFGEKKAKHVKAGGRCDDVLNSQACSGGVSASAEGTGVVWAASHQGLRGPRAKSPSLSPCWALSICLHFDQFPAIPDHAGKASRNKLLQLSNNMRILKPSVLWMELLCGLLLSPYVNLSWTFIANMKKLVVGKLHRIVSCSGYFSCALVS